MVGYFLIETDPEILRRFLMSLIGSAIFFYFTYSILCYVNRFLQCKPTNAHTALELQSCFNMSTPTRFGPHRSILRACTVA